MEPGTTGGVADDESEEESAVVGARLIVCRYLRLVGVACVEDAVVSGAVPKDVRARVSKEVLVRVVLRETHLLERRCAVLYKPGRFKTGVLMTCRTGAPLSYVDLRAASMGRY